jgi:hypothetical protein
MQQVVPASEAFIVLTRAAIYTWTLRIFANNAQAVQRIGKHTYETAEIVKYTD